MTEFLLYYLGVGYVINNILALIAIYGSYPEEVEVEMGSFIITIPAWPYTLYQVIVALFNKE